MSKVINSDENRIYVIGMDIDKDSPEEIARDAGMQILDIFDRLLEQQKAKEEASEQCDN